MLSFLTLHIQFCPTTTTTYTTHIFTFLNHSGKEAMVTMVNRPFYLEAIFNPRNMKFWVVGDLDEASLGAII
jgi:hypothetical protein